MATVYRAYDEVLDREVALKVLHDYLAADPAFLDRFLREARAAAALTHPNVVAVYDWGKHDDGAFLVLQLIEGPTLRQALQHLGPLSEQEVAGVLIPAARGLGAAHQAGLVHRDIKPENVLLGRDGLVRITDFGLARASATTSTTFGTGVLVGSPHYLSPEAVRGEALDARADVYALGVVLFECLVGRPPHAGESAYATALAHTAQPVPAPSTLVEDLDPALDEIVGWATAIDQSHRYTDATDFARALRNAVSEPTPLTALLDAMPAETLNHADVDVAARSPDSGGVNVDVDGDDDAGDNEPTTMLSSPARHRRGWMVLLTIVTLIAAAAYGGYLLWDQYFAPVVEVPTVVGEEADYAAAQLVAAGLSPEWAEQTQHSLEVAAGRVVAQNPQGQARSGSVVTLVLSAGPRQITVPPVASMTVAQAVASLRDESLEVDQVEVFDDDVPPGLVVATRPPSGAVVDEGSRVELLISQGPEPSTVPSVIGEHLDIARRLATDAQLDIEIVGRRFDESPTDTVLEQRPQPDEQVDRGSVIEVIVSDGPPPIAVPPVRGKQVREAVAELEALGFDVRVELRGGLGAVLTPGQVFDQDPGPGSTRRAGDVIRLFAYEG